MSPFLLSHPFHLLFSSSLLLLLLFHIPTANGLIIVACEGTTAYNATSPFASNLNLLLPSLSSNSARNRGFYEGKIGVDPDTVYGQILCRGDSSSAECYDCINKASESILGNCNNTKSATVWYDTCQLRYSDTNFFRNSMNKRVVWFRRKDSIPPTDLGSFKGNLTTLMYGLASEIKANQWLRNFATGEATYGDSMTVYGLVQCVPDISPNDCYTCLTDTFRRAIPKCCVDREGGRVVGHVCALRFETTGQFYNDSLLKDPEKENEKPLDVNCEGTTTYNAASSFASNLNLLFPSLSLNSAREGGFYEDKKGVDLDTVVYGQILCRGDSESDKCRDCIDKAIKAILSSCNTKSATIWYDTCQLRYSDTDFFKNLTNPWLFSRQSNDPIPATDLDSFQENLRKLMYELAGEIKTNQWLRNFATRDANYAGLKTVYGLVQCVPNITPTDCSTCLTDAIRVNIPLCCADRTAGRVIGHVCGLRFETTFKFYNMSKVADTSKGVNIVLILVPVFTGLIIFVLMGALLLISEWRPWKKENKAETAPGAQTDVKKETGKEEEINVDT